jgi:hypothetical protein
LQKAEAACYRVLQAICERLEKKLRTCIVERLKSPKAITHNTFNSTQRNMSQADNIQLNGIHVTQYIGNMQQRDGAIMQVCSCAVPVLCCC